MILPLPYNPVPVYYSGGLDIRQYRGLTGEDGLVSPEDWVCSSTSTYSGATDSVGDPIGFSRIEDGRTVPDLIAADPQGWLGTEQPQDADFLLKLLNPGVRIPVHWHPDAAFARNHLGVANGKAEAWIILSDTATVWLGFENGTTTADLKNAIADQDTEWMLARMHPFELARNDTVYVPPGLVHAIGTGALMAEIQEPSSASILAEHETLGLTAERASLSVGWDTAMECLGEPTPRSGLLDLLGTVPQEQGQSRLLTDPSREFFQASVVNVAGNASVAVQRLSAAIVDEGPLEWVDPETGGRTSAPPGSSWLLGAGLGTWNLEGTGRVLLFSGPNQ